MKTIKLLLLCALIVPSMNYAQKDSRAIRAKTFHDLLVKFGLTDSLQRRLKERGFDLRSELEHPTHPSECLKVLACDVAVIGKVKTVRDEPAPENTPFYGRTVIEVKQIFKGTIGNGNQIEILQENGPSHLRILANPPAPRFEPGEEAIFFLERPEHSSYLLSPYMQEKYHDYFKSNGFRYPTNVFWIDNNSKVIGIENGRAHFSSPPHSTSKPLEEVIKNIRATLKLLEN